jgi:DNA polymerase-3 subunit delta'
VSRPGSAPLPPSLEEATEDQPAARAAFAAAFAAGPTHAYALFGPAGTGKRAAARAFAAELLAAASADPERARRRALADPSPHPDLAWLRPPGNQHLVDEVRERVIGAVSFRPFEGERRLFVIEDAEAMAEESQNALLKTLEEPPAYAHLLLVSSEPAGLLATVRSRCREIPFSPLPRAAVERRLASELDLPPESLAALAALADGDLGRARFLASERGSRLRELTETCARSARAGRIGERPWSGLAELAGEIGGQEGAAVEAAARARADELGKGRDADRLRREGAEAAKRADRRARTGALEAALGLTAAWFLDLIACAEGVPEQVRNRDRLEALEADAEGLDPGAAGRSAELAMATRRHLGVNVNEELALDALFHGAASAFGARSDVL